MPRHSDPELEGRILNAARKLWHKGGETALSMRAVAKAAGTNTPAVYRRFRTREQILRALVQILPAAVLSGIGGLPVARRSRRNAIWILPSAIHGSIS